MSTYIPAELVDDLTEVYVEWCEECVALRVAYERWGHGPVTERAQAFAAYLAALEREEQASAVYADRLYEIEREPQEPIAPSPLGDRIITVSHPPRSPADQSRAG